MTDVQQAVPVAQEDREFAAQWIVIAPANARMIKAGDWDHHDGVQAAARHRIASLPCKSGEGARLVPVEQLREWYTGAWATWLETIGDADDDEDRPTPAHLNEMEALLSVPDPDATQTREAETTREGCVGTMDANRAIYFLERFKREEKLLGPHEQWALDFTIAALSAGSAGQ